MAANDNQDRSFDPSGGGDPNPANPYQAAGGSQGFGHPVYDQIGNYMKQYWGTNPSFQDVSGWGTNVDSRYMEAIRGSIASHPNAKAYQDKLAAQHQTSSQNGAAASSPVTASGQIPPPGQNPQPALAQTAAPAPTGQAPTSGPGALTSIFNSPVGQAQTQALLNLLQNPHSMTTQGVQQLKEQQKESALSMQQQMLGQLGQSAAARNVYGGGTQLGLEGQANQAAIGQILNSNRGIDITKMQQDRQDELNALGAAGSYQNQALQQGLGQQGLTLDWARLGEQGRQYDLGNQLDWQKMMDSGWNWRANLGLGYAGLDQSSQIALVNLLFGRGA